MWQTGNLAADTLVCGVQYVNWCNGGSKDAFFTNDGCHQLFKNHIRHFANRCLQRLVLASAVVFLMSRA